MSFKKNFYVGCKRGLFLITYYLRKSYQFKPVNLKVPVAPTITCFIHIGLYHLTLFLWILSQTRLFQLWWRFIHFYNIQFSFNIRQNSFPLYFWSLEVLVKDFSMVFSWVFASYSCNISCNARNTWCVPLRFPGFLSYGFHMKFMRTKTLQGTHTNWVNISGVLYFNGIWSCLRANQQEWC